MANPQKEHGYTAVSNEIFEALARIRIPGEARQTLDVVIRQTYGFQKKEDSIALSQFCLKTGMGKRAIIRAIHTLAGMNLLGVKKDTQNTTKYRFNKDFDTWKPLSKKTRGVSKKTTRGVKKDNDGVSKKTHTKEISTKETIQKKGESATRPTQEAVISFFREQGAPLLEAQKFFNYFQSNGWKVGGRAPMKDWQAAARNWILKLPKEAIKPVYKPEPAPERPPVTDEDKAKVRELVKNAFVKKEAHAPLR